MGVQTLVVTIAQEAPEEPLRVATAAASNLVNELVVLTFASYHPMAMQPPKAEGEPAHVVARPFVSVAMPRSTFGAWLKSTLTMIKGIEDRSTFGWDEIVREIGSEGT